MSKKLAIKNKLQLQLFSSAHANKIKTIRKKLNMSQDRFGKKFGVSGKTVSAYENGKCAPPLRVLEKISKIYGTGFTAIDVDMKADLINKINYVKNVICELEDKLIG